MERAPVLGREAIRAALEAVFRGQRSRNLVALYGQAPEAEASGWVELVTLGGAGEKAEVRVVPVRSELELRAKLPPLREDDAARMAFLVPWSHDVPLDLAGRFALNGRVRPVGKDLRLAALFGVVQLDDEARRCALGAWLLGGGAGRKVAPVGGHTLTLDAMWEAWLTGACGLDASGGVGLDALVAFAATDGKGPDVAAQMAGEDGQRAREALLGWLEKKAGVAAPWVWKAWERGLGGAALETALLCEPLVGDPRGEVRMWLKTTVRQRLGIQADGAVLAVAGALGEEAAAIGRAFERGGEPGRAALRAGARAADDSVVDAEVREWLVGSPRLPSAWAGRLARLGAALEAGAGALGGGGEAARQAAAGAVAALKGLEGHVSFLDPEQKVPLERAEMATRLLCWLASGEVPEEGVGLTPYADTETLGRWYVAEGGWVDRARHLARGGPEDALGRGVSAVLAAADQRREALDLRFARSLVGWVEAGQPATRVVPIDMAVKRVAARFLEGRPDRRLLVVLMDGMAWAQATELLASLSVRAAPWGPLRWHVGEGKTGDGPLPVVLAALPTVTEASRAAFFAGKLPWHGGAAVAKDEELWKKCAAIRPFAGSDGVARLLLRGESHTGAGGASAEALALVGDETRRVVAVVVNAIDESLKSSHALRHPWGVDNIASLGALFDKAREAGRAVLLASDHGHVPVDRLAYAPAPGGAAGGARWRAWPSAGAPVAEWEVAFAGERVMKPAGAHGVVLVADDRHRYGALPHAGEHGGATLAEVVAPCVLVGCEETPGALDDDEQRPLPMASPRWWHLETAPAVVGAVVVQVAPARAKAKSDKQLTLAGIVEETPASQAAGPSRAAALATSAVWKALGLNEVRASEVLKAVEALVARHGVMSAEAFAEEVGQLPFRVGGFVAKVGEVLNQDGFPVIRFDAAARQVTLNVELLGQIFEVTL